MSPDPFAVEHRRLSGGPEHGETVLLADGNIGIDGDPDAIRRRTRPLAWARPGRRSR